MTEILVADSLTSALKLAGVLSLAYILVLWLSAVVWVYRDVRTRTGDPLSQSVATLLVGLFNLPGLIVYLVIRPHETIADSYERSLEAEAMLHELQLETNVCQSCRRTIEADYNVCPHCRALLREPCHNCNKPIRTNWTACAFCGADNNPARAAAPLSRETTAPGSIRAPARETAAQPGPPPSQTTSTASRRQ